MKTIGLANVVAQIDIIVNDGNTLTNEQLEQILALLRQERDAEREEFRQATLDVCESYKLSTQDNEHQRGWNDALRNIVNVLLSLGKEEKE
jgi:hypothetical protein